MRCADLNASFADMASEYDIWSGMLSYWEVNAHLVNRVRLLQDENVAIPEERRQKLLHLSGEEKDRLDLHQLLK